MVDLETENVHPSPTTPQHINNSLLYYTVDLILNKTTYYRLLLLYYPYENLS